MSIITVPEPCLDPKNKNNTYCECKNSRIAWDSLTEKPTALRHQACCKWMLGRLNIQKAEGMLL